MDLKLPYYSVQHLKVISKFSIIFRTLNLVPWVPKLIFLPFFFTCIRGTSKEVNKSPLLLRFKVFQFTTQRLWCRIEKEIAAENPLSNRYSRLVSRFPLTQCMRCIQAERMLVRTSWPQAQIGGFGCGTWPILNVPRWWQELLLITWMVWYYSTSKDYLIEYTIVNCILTEYLKAENIVNWQEFRYFHLSDLGHHNCFFV